MIMQTAKLLMTSRSKAKKWHKGLIGSHPYLILPYVDDTFLQPDETHTIGNNGQSWLEVVVGKNFFQQVSR